MKDLSLHFFDVLENSAKAGASMVIFRLTWRGQWLSFAFLDNGPGFPPSIAANPADPFLTTRRERSVGLGLALLRQAAIATGGGLTARNRPSGGAHVRGRINVAHLDAQPLGRMDETIILAIAAWPSLNLLLRVGPQGKTRTILDTAAVKKEIGDLSINHPEIRRFVRETLRDGLREMQQWAEEQVS